MTGTKTRFQVQWRTNSGWETLRGYRTEEGALRVLRSVSDKGSYRVISGDRNGAFTIHAVRN